MNNHFVRVCEKTKENITSNNLIFKGDRVLCALSGGADSVALLVILKKLSNELDFSLCAAHLNHGIRGSEADRDERYCQKLCLEYDVPFVSERVDVPSEAKSSGEGIEECARRLRYDFLRRAAASFECNKICTAHHADDNIETVLMHIIRGCGLTGLAGISPVNGNIVRPLLTVRKTELTEALNEQNIEFVFDSTNSSLDSTRNYVRHKILPHIYEINPSADKAFYRMCEGVAQDIAYFDGAVSKLDRGLSKKELAALPSAMLSRYVIKRYEELFDGESVPQLENKSLKLIVNSLKSASSTVKYDISGNVTVYIEESGLTFEKRGNDKKQDFEIPLEMGENIISLIGYRILIEEDKKVADAWQNIYKSSTLLSVNFDKISKDKGLCVYVRNRRTGDSYVFGKMRRDIRRQLINRKIPLRMRDSLPCFCTDSELFLVHGLPLADGMKPTGGAKTVYIGCVYDESVKTKII